MSRGPALHLAPHLAALAAGLRAGASPTETADTLERLAPIAAELERAAGATVTGDASPMSPAELRAILARLGWSQRFLGAILPALPERRARSIAAGREPVPPYLAAWLRHQVAHPPPGEAELAGGA